MKQFEYLVKSSYPEQEDLNKLGAQGWELIHITESRYIYKREKPTEDEVIVEEVPKGVRMDDVDKDNIRKALEETKWNKHEAAAKLGIAERSLNRKIKQYGLKK